MKKLLWITIAVWIQYHAVAQQYTPELLTTYLALKETLVQGQREQASESAVRMKNVLEKEVQFSEKKELLKHVISISKSTDIEKQRSSFAALSVLMWKVIQREKNIPTDVYYAYCPMKKMYWISSESTIRNPYYGASMLDCGRVTDKRLK